MPRKGPAYPIDTEWRRRVERRIEEMQISHAEFARRGGFSKASLSEALNPESTQSTLVPVIHKTLGWPAPRSLLLSRDDEELLSVAGRMDPRDRAALLERALTMEETRKKKH